MTREQKLEAALRFVHDDSGFRDLEPHTLVAVLNAIATPPDADTRVVTPDMIRGWLDGFKAALDTAKSITVSVGTVSQSDIVGVLQSSFDLQRASISDEPRIVSTWVSWSEKDHRPPITSTGAGIRIIEGKDHE